MDRRAFLSVNTRNRLAQGTHAQLAIAGAHEGRNLGIGREGLLESTRVGENNAQRICRPRIVKTVFDHLGSSQGALC